MGVDLVDDTEQMVLNMGPEHPSTHGLLRLVVHLDGEVVIKVEPKLGYLHRGFEKIAESHTYPQFIPFTDRLDYLSAPANNLGYTQAVEKLAGIEVPERAEYLRVIFAELARIASHMVMIGSTALDMAGVTPWAYCFRDRERILDLFEMTTGSRLTVNLLRIGGISKEPPPEFWLALQSFLDDLPKVVEEYQGIFFGNEIAMARLKSVGIFSREWVKKYGLTGPISRASGISFDVRKAEPYGIYDRFDFQIPVRYGCDSYDRTLIRLDEMVESAKIIRQAVRDIPEGAVLAKVPKVLKPPVGEVYHRVENPKGEMGFYVVSDGTNKPVRVHIRSASFINLQILPVAAVGCKIQDLILIFSSLDPVAGEVDK